MVLLCICFRQKTAYEMRCSDWSSYVCCSYLGFGSGSFLAALTLPRILDRVADRTIMIGAAAAMMIGLALLAVLTASFGAAPGYWRMVLIGWFILGIAYSMSVTPSGRLLRQIGRAHV